MTKPGPHARRQFLLQSHPALLLHGALLYALGAAIASYLGINVRPWPYLAGQAAVLALQAGAHYLDAFYGLPQAQTLPNSRTQAPAQIPRRWSLYAAAGAFGTASIAVTALLASGELGPADGVLIGLGALAAVAFGSPPLRLKESGYGEVLASVATAVLIPTFAFILQADQVHRLPFMTAAPLACFTFAALLIEQLRTYSRAVKLKRGGLMFNLGWKWGMRVHDSALVVGFALQLAWLFSAFPQRVALGGLLGLPLALTLIWYLGRIRDGAPPRWTALRLGSQGLVGLMTYLNLSGYLLS